MPKGRQAMKEFPAGKRPSGRAEMSARLH